MKKSIKIIVILLFILSISLNVWQVMMKRPLSPNAGNRINFEIKAKDINKSTFRIATYNIRSGKGLDGIRNIKRTASILNGFDIIALNEVKGETLLSHSSQAEKLGEMLDMGWLFLPNQRAIRGAQLSYVINKFKKHNHCILIGDLNSSRRDLQLMDLLGEKNTIDAINVALGPNDTLGRVDWIIVKGFNVIDGGYVPKGISDHRLYWVELEINQRYDPPLPHV
jgi:endonuclease/exonuclease/phosphatase family metal-dependent hydrolase